MIEKSLAATLEMQRWPKDLPVDRGGWRYITDDGMNDSDLSITGWQLMFLRSARNAGFDVPQQPIDDAVQYVRRTFNKRNGTFGYVIAPTFASAVAAWPAREFSRSPTPASTIRRRRKRRPVDARAPFR